jgi:hypothetical protein
MAINQFFPFSPDFNTWEHFNGGLLHYYGEEPIPMLSEDEWKQVALSVGQLATFINYPVPDPEMYDTWQDWTLAFTEIINGPTR